MPTQPYMPSADDVAAARAALETLRAGNEVSFEEMPHTLKQVLLDMLAQIARNEPVAIMPLEAQLTTKEAADLLGVSRPHLVKLLERGEIPFTRVGKHRRVLLKDVLEYQERIREEALDELQRQAQELGLDYY
ncbi:helix-turn-helix domain-containing protein [Oceanithermus sp.]|uniref:helix-turn-helix domain-containing protein n=1 Tax=Oceanithermus sp. TaxID=2268145 RepID=UPI0025803C6D|nr:helix-turn-helix domain-containing protein [Oceanithermus sp.]